jgi:hypothetical protein
VIPPGTYEWLRYRVVASTADLVRGRLPQGDFAEDVYGITLGCTFSPDRTLDVFQQNDTESDSLGTNTRLRWHLTPASQVFLVVNYSALDPGGPWASDARETVLKVQHEARF